MKEVKVTWYTAKYGDPYSEYDLCCGGRGAVGGSTPCSRAPQSWYLGWRECYTFTPHTYNSCRTWDSNSQSFDYECNSLTIRTRLSPTICDVCENCHENYFTMHFSGPYASIYLCIFLSTLQYWSATISILCEIEVYLIVYNVYLYFKP